jgi:FtsP/CotA-like multicopper oxidase with cupredoxin domain
MSAIHRSLLAVLALGLAAGSGTAQTPSCPPRPNPGSVVTNPPDIASQNGVLNATFTFRSSFDTLGYLHECYIYQTGQGPVEAPTLRLNAGDQLVLDLINRLTYLPPPPPGPKAAKAVTGMPGMPGMTGRTTPNDPCTGGTMVATSTNIHFHGLNIPPICHQDEILTTDVENTDPPFQYKLQIPMNDAPGMYWYHPHLHGEVTLQVNGGAPGALVIGGIEKLKPQVAGLPERIFVVRQQFTNPNSWIAGPYQLTLNYQPAIAPFSPSPIIRMKPGVKEFWRVANASSQAFLSLQVWFGTTAQKLEVVELDGIPVNEITQVTTIDIPPAGRAEFIMQGPAEGQTASFQHINFNSGPIGNPNLAQELAMIATSTDAPEPPALPAASAPSSTPLRFAGLATATVTAKRKIYFAEATNGSNGPTEFFITVDGQKPKVFSMSEPPAVTTTVGAVEDWTVENRTGETHAFHIHQIHFLFLAVNGVPYATPDLRDTVIVPAWSGTGPYPTVTLRMDFREPQIAGTFVFHCHVLDHEDAGMMAIIQVNPK